ncbi:hypothetical protein ABT218_23720 [Streptomyces sp. NPDC001455]|uniref:hypothetical protein n=1 Tax=Streptomyces sp. NPDC001455 TaxID=3154518 RepID=UPI00332B0D15
MQDTCKKANVSKSHAYEALRGDKLPSPEVVQSLVEAWGEDAAPWLRRRSEAAQGLARSSASQRLAEIRAIEFIRGGGGGEEVTLNGQRLRPEHLLADVSTLKDAFVDIAQSAVSNLREIHERLGRPDADVLATYATRSSRTTVEVVEYILSGEHIQGIQDGVLHPNVVASAFGSVAAHIEAYASEKGVNDDAMSHLVGVAVEGMDYAGTIALAVEAQT